MKERRQTSSKALGRRGLIGEPTPLRIDPQFRRVLWCACVITGAMFLIETVAGHVSGSQALQADALDFLDDALTYALALAAASTSKRLHAAATLSKWICLCLAGVWILGSSLYQASVPVVPRADIMTVTGLLAIVANAICVALLARYRNRTSSADAAWMHSRNDMLGNCLVILTAAAVWLSQSPWPDLLIAVVAAANFLGTATWGLRQSLGEYRKQNLGQ